jgi:two-component system NarL family response regulator
MDLNMPAMSGVEATQAIRKRDPQARIIILTTYDGDVDIHRAIQAGARSYLLKDMFGEQLIQTIRAVYARHLRIPTKVVEILIEKLGSATLTPRELEVLNLIVKGKSNKEIGNTIYIAEATVKSHINKILEKLGVKDRTQIVRDVLIARTAKRHNAIVITQNLSDFERIKRFCAVKVKHPDEFFIS